MHFIINITTYRHSTILNCITYVYFDVIKIFHTANNYYIWVSILNNKLRIDSMFRNDLKSLNLVINR